MPASVRVSPDHDMPYDLYLIEQVVNEVAQGPGQVELRSTSG